MYVLIHVYNIFLRGDYTDKNNSSHGRHGKYILHILHCMNLIFKKSLERWLPINLVKTIGKSGQCMGRKLGSF